MDRISPENIDQYISKFPNDIQAILEKIRQTIRTAAPNAEETISYQIPTFKLYGNLVHFAAYTNHIGFYPAPSGIKKFTTELSPYQTAKGSIKFPLSKPIPYELIGKITAFRVEENLAKAAAKKKKN